MEVNPFVSARIVSMSGVLKISFQKTLQRLDFVIGLTGDVVARSPEEQWAFEIFPDGVIKYYAYPRAGRKVLDKDKVQIDASRVIAFYDDLLQVFKPWYDFVDCKVCDGCSYELNITYIDGRKKKRTGDVGGGSIDKTIMEFLCTIPEMKEKIMEEE